MNKQRLFLLFFPVIFFLASGLDHVRAQSPLQIDLPQVAPLLPQAAAIARYGEIPVDYSTGVPNISIPIYTIKSHELELPISLSYHSSGIKVNDVAVSVGLGWVLNAGGVVAQTVIGRGNVKPSYKTAEEWRTQRDIQCTTVAGHAGFSSILEREYARNDWQSDRFFFQTPGGQSGIFRYDFLTDALVKIPYSPVRIQQNAGTGNGFTITAEDGTIYDYSTMGEQDNSTYSWFLTRMITASLTDTIRFFYGSSNVFGQMDCYCILDYGDAPDPNTNELRVSVQPFKDGYPNFSRTMLVDSIVSSTTVIRFSYIGDRQDIPNKRLGKIAVYDRFTRSLVKEFALTHSYFGSTAHKNKRLRLEGLSMRSSNSLPVENYSFVYENSVELPPYRMKCEDFSEDYWGYYNGTSSFYQIPDQFVPAMADGSSYSIPISPDYVTDRTPNPYYAQAAMIKEIHYPTGGKTVFEFEPNSATAAYDYPPSTSYQDGNVGGFRIRKITSYANANDPGLIKTYTYDPGITRTVRSDLFTYQQEFVYRATSGSNIISRTVSTSSSLLPLTADNGNMAFYPSVTEYMGTETANTGKTVYSYAFPPSSNTPEIPALSNAYEDDKGNYTPRLSSRIEYKNDNGWYKPVTKTENDYTSYRSNSFSTGMHVLHRRTYIGITEPWYIDAGYASNFYFFDTKATEEVSLLHSTRSYAYADDSVAHLTNQVTYTYGNMDHLLPTEEAVINSKGETISTQLKYPVDFVGQQPYADMVNKNIVSPVIAQEKYKGAEFLQGTKTGYKDWGNGIIAPEKVETRQGGSLYEPRIRFNAYDNRGNVLSVSKENNMKISYIWGYNKTYPVAEVTNASENQIAYTSFESDDYGGWSSSSGGVVANRGITGTKAFRGLLSKTVPSGTYIVTLWSTDAAVVNNQQGTVLVTIGNWSLRKWVLNNPSTVQVISADLDEIRLYPSTSQMTTYTFAPLIGITSKCDATGRIQYYEYDSFGRLALIRDERRNILKKFCYNYQGQQENCSYTTLYLSTEFSGTYSRQNCLPDQVAIPYGIYVPAGSYTSNVSQEDADQKARDYAQQQANLHGICDCNYTICTGPDKMCRNGICETGTLVVMRQYEDDWECMTDYGYKFLDGTIVFAYTQYYFGHCNPIPY